MQWFRKVFLLLLVVGVEYVTGQTLEDQICIAPYLAQSSDLTIETDSYGTLSCYLYCDNGESNFYYDDNELKSMKIIVIFFSSFGLILSVILCLNICTQHIGEVSEGSSKDRKPVPAASPRKKRGHTQSGNQTFCWRMINEFRGRPFTYDVPFAINCGYIAIMLSLLSPHILGRENVTCNTDEKTYTQNNPKSGNHLCSFIGFFVLAGIHTIGIYQAALAFSLFRKLYSPNSKRTLRKLYVHCILWTIVAIFSFTALGLSAFGADTVLGICSSGLSNRSTLLGLNVIPIGIEIGAGFIFLVAAVYLLCRHTWYQQGVGINKRYSQKMRRFLYRFIIYTFVATAALILYEAAMIMFYVHLDEYKASAGDWVFCKIAQEVLASTTPCTHDGAPPMWLYAVLPVIAWTITFSGLILSCTDDNMSFWRNKVKGLAQSSSRMMRLQARSDAGDDDPEKEVELGVPRDGRDEAPTITSSGPDPTSSKSDDNAGASQIEP